MTTSTHTMQFIGKCKKLVMQKLKGTTFNYECYTIQTNVIQ